MRLAIHFHFTALFIREFSFLANLRRLELQIPALLITKQKFESVSQMQLCMELLVSLTANGRTAWLIYASDRR